MYSLGIDIGSSSVKASLLEIETNRIKASLQSPDGEMTITSSAPGYAEQHPDLWWKQLGNVVRKLLSDERIFPGEIKCIGITYQMHGLIMLDKKGELLRPSIIWCDSRAVSNGLKLAEAVGQQTCFDTLLNEPGNFTASKLAWVKENEPELFKECSTIMLPGDWINYKMTGERSTTVSGLSEAILWNFKDHSVADALLKELEITGLIPTIQPAFGIQGTLNETAAAELGLKKGIPVTYRAGDQPNNAFSLNVTEPGEVAGTAGTSGVIYAVTEKYDPKAAQGLNAFAHVNHEKDKKRLGILLCINGTGIANSWIKKICGNSGYEKMNQEAAQIPAGSEELVFLPFGNGAERMFGNKRLDASLYGINFNVHTPAHIYRAAQEGIAFAFYYGMKRMQAAGVNTHTIKAGKANLFQSPVFTKTLSAISGSTILLYNTDGAAGAARGAARGAGIYSSAQETFAGLKLEEKIEQIHPGKDIEQSYKRWEEILEQQLKNQKP